MTISDPGSVSSATRWHLLPAEKVLEQLQSDRQLGLTLEQVAERQRQFGPNELEDTGGRSNWAILLDQFKNIMLIMLIAVAIISGVMDLMDMQAGRVKSNDIPFKDTVAILAIVFLNGLLGYVQESRAEKALAALKNMASPQVRVVRDGRVQEVSAGELVPGDIMLLEAGAQVAADGRLLEEASLQVREAALTGEAQAVSKRVSADLSEDTPLGDRLNCVYQGTEVVQGRGVAVVTQTGMGTELGKIATLLQSVEAEPTPLQQRMDQLSQALVTGSLSLVAGVVVLGLLVAGWGKLRELVEVSLSMAVAVVPEGLPAVITVTLALGTQRMVRRHALIRKLPAVETLGSVTTICSDKTGTLTQNKMVVQGIHQYSCSLSVTGHAYTPEGEFLLNGQPIDTWHHLEAIALLTAGILCNDAALQKENGGWCILGDPTEGALLVAATKAGLDRHQLSYAWTRLGEFPFTSERKRMSVMVKQEGGGTATDVMGAIAPLLLPSSSLLLFCKGSPELVLERCQFVYVKGTVEPLSGDRREQILQQNNHLASKGLRVLGFAARPLEALPAEDSAEETEQGLIWLGLVDMLDAPRPEAREAVARCRSAGIRPVMITGDHQLTARAIAEDMGIAQPGDEVLTGPELEHCTPEELEAHVERVSVYARVAPEHKLKIVQALQRRHHIVAMTGDGVNDAPALKRADIGIAMGITGTDVSKEASDMVLLDDNFATIVSAVEEGRVVYTNIRRFIKYILGSNIGEVITIAASPLFAFGGVPLTPLQILWMNLVTDGLPALALAVEPAEPNVMSRPPHDPKESIFARGLGTYMIRIGVVLSIIAIAQMVVGYHLAQTIPGDPDRWKTMVFTTLCLAQMGHALAIRSNTRLTLELNPFSNPYVLTSVVFTSLLQLALIYVEPLRNFFGTQILSPLELLICLGFSLLLFVWIELEKILSRWQGKGAGVGD
ncbi:cation-translocating P-type ATPase [Thermoleptolyngbya sichuanensis XZ-Cy5]|uniref:cation-translocating P-type ATPase n=1 Tax=Thermoleptolyngbya sichuanensis TaxID=2885951 RepID=UPI00240D51DB|nr:cation-translocating P-type ATPase [Thermoleptolyngbya sichuanensis]MDG2616306.1 cation-translocating P-type ATPase [Thermoleptolyngbya sichuanensis XZ-Cy5]